MSLCVLNKTLLFTTWNLSGVFVLTASFVPGWKVATELWTWVYLMRPWLIWRAGWLRFWKSTDRPKTCWPSSDTCWLKELSSTVPTARYAGTNPSDLLGNIEAEHVPTEGLLVCDESFCPDCGWMCVFSLQGALVNRNKLGIMFRHAYSLTAVETVNVPKQDSYFVYLTVFDLT